MFARIKTQTEHPALPKSGFTLDHIMHLDVDFHRLELTRGGSHIELPDWIASKKDLCLNGFRTESVRDKHYKYCSSHGEVNVKMPTEKDK